MLTKNILATIVYYDVMDYPLTVFEVWKHLMNVTGKKIDEKEKKKYNLLAITKELKNSRLRKFIEEFQGFYYLKGRKDLVEQRSRRNKISVSKIKKLRKVTKWIQYVPYVRMISITGRLAMKNAQEKSDWDVLIAIQKGRMWTGRTLVTLFTHILGKRRYKNKIQDRVCLNYFLTDQSLEIATKDFFSAHEYFFMRPFYNWKLFRKFQLKNYWISDLKINYNPEEISPDNILTKSSFCSKIKYSLEKLLKKINLEDLLRKVEKKKIEKNPKTHQEGSLIEATDEALVFLPKPQGPKVYERFREKLSKL